MYIPLPLVLLTVLILVLFASALLRRTRRADLVEPPRPLSIGHGTEMDVRGLLEQGDKIEAIRRVRAEAGCGLAEAKAYVERLDPSHS